MSESIEMVYTACIEWLDDWLAADPPILRDEYDFAQWMTHTMRSATECFLSYAFTSARARNDAVLILRALYYEYFLFRQQLAIKHSNPNSTAVTRLLALPQTTQKSASWHAEARDLLTGHEFGAVCYGTEARRNQIVAKKCIPETVITEENIQSRHVFCKDEEGELSALKWGWRYEPVARMVFERIIADGEVNDTLGRIRHHSLPRLAASPDGLIVSGPRCGRLVEIKCPITRELTGVIPMDYYCQMQLQAEVCDVDAVEYVEVRFASLTNQTQLSEAQKNLIGKVVVASTSSDADPSTYTYEYSPLYPATAQGYADAQSWIPNNSLIVVEESLWYVKDLFTKTVLRNSDWWTDVGYPAYVEFWKTVDEARSDGRFAPRGDFVDSDDDVAAAAPAAVDGWNGIDSE